MTQRVRTGYKNHRRASLAALLAVAAVAALAALALVLPALGATGIPPASGKGVTPTAVNVGGSNFNCTTNTGGQPAGMHDPPLTVSTPPNSTAQVVYNSSNSNLPAGVTFTLKGYSSAAQKGKFFDLVSVTGASVFHIAVKGGNDVAWYDYFDNPSTSGGVTSDTGLHATINPQNNNLFNASFTTFCYATATTIKGRVFLDNNGNGTFDTSSTPPDAGQNGWTVKLFTSAGVQVGSSLTTPSPGSDPAGSYTFTGVPIGGNYKVCVLPPSGTWDQSVPSALPPNGNTACSSVAGALPAGRVISNLPAAGASDQDFGNQPTFVPSCGTNVGPEALAGSQIVEYTAQLTNPDGSDTCKPAVVMYSYLDGSQPYAIIHPTASAGANPFWVVERLRMMVDEGGIQNPVTLKYDDSAPYGSAYTTMKMCTADPRVAGDNFKLAEDPSTVMPAGTTADGGPHTTCMIQSTDLPSGGVTAGGVTYNYEAYIATDVDGIKTPT